MRRVSDRWRPATTALLAAVLVAVLGAVLDQVLSGYYVFLGTTAIVAMISLLGLGVVTGSAGMISLCQLSFAALGAWTVSELNVRQVPGGPLVWLLLAAIGPGLVGVIVGLPALRLRGVNLAVVTLGFAAAVDETLTRTQFPGATEFIPVAAPTGFQTDRQFFLLSVIVLGLCVFVVQLLRGSRAGSAWVFLAFSERGLASAGGSVPFTKLSAFGLSAALGGLSGGLVTMQVGIATAETFAPLQSLSLYVLSIVVGSHLVDMAILGGLLFVVVPEILNRLNLSQNWGLVLFGVLGVQALCSKSNLGQTIRDVVRRRRDATTAADTVAPVSSSVKDDGPGPEPSPPDTRLLEVHGLAIAFGAVKALQGVDLNVDRHQIHGLIGPNGAGKSTLIDALSGFLPRHSGTISFAGVTVGRTPPTQLARRGLRRTFQQDRVPTELSVGAYVRYVARRRVSDPELDELLAFFAGPARSRRLASVDVGIRRVVEIAAHLASRPKLLLLDEPAAGLSKQEHLVLGQRLAEIPSRFGAAVLLIEHDLDLVRQVCPTVTVLDFGQVLAAGEQDETLNSPAVIRAYMGEVVAT